MTNFDYITSPEFRASIFSDYEEMQKSAASQSWKSAQVLAGSIVECLLIDYLISTPNPARPSKDPLKMDLSEAINICKEEKVISDRTADLCSVIRSYRNLIHPGRMVRLNESLPDQNTCDIAVALIDIIVSEVSKTRRATAGLNGEQILSKVLRDANCLSILPHLMNEVNDEQRLSLLLNLLPQAYFDYQDIDEFDVTKERISSAFRSIFEFATIEIKKTVAQKYVKILKEEDGDSVDNYKKAFFKANDLEFIDESSFKMVREHLLAAVPQVHNSISIRSISGIGGFLGIDDCMVWFDPFMKALVSPTARPHIKKIVREAFIEEIFYTKHEVDAKLQKRIKDWINHYNKNESPTNAAIAQELLDEVMAFTPPI